MLSTKSQRLVELLRGNHQLAREQADHPGRILACTFNAGRRQLSCQTVPTLSGSHRKEKHRRPVGWKDLPIPFSCRTIPD